MKKTAAAALVVALLSAMAILRFSKDSTPGFKHSRGHRGAPAAVDAEAEPAPDAQVPQGNARSAPAEGRPPAEPSELREWLRTMPDRAFASRIGTEELDRHVAEIISDLCRRYPEQSMQDQEVGLFLREVNERILSLGKKS